MSRDNLARVPSGVPTGGQFAAGLRAEPKIGLAPVPVERTFAALLDYEVDASFTVPQANDLEKVVLVADAVESGANTADAIADALDVHAREGGYYANAAGYLGLVEVDKSDGVYAYHLTSLGEALRECDDNDRAEMIAQMVARVPEVQVYIEDGEDELHKAIASADLTGDTVTRRAACIRSWITATDDRTGLSTRIGAAGDASEARFSAAAEKARTQIAAARAARTPEPTYTFCPDCYLALPATGECDMCA